MKKIALLTVISLLLCLCFSGCRANKTQWAPIELTRRDAATDAPIPGSEVIVAVSPEAPLGGLELFFNLTGDSPSATVSIYKATVDYATTLAEKPVRQEKFSELAANMMWQFRTLPAGDYLIVFSDLNAATLSRSIVPSDKANGKILNYCNGNVMTDGTCVMTLLCIKTADNPDPGLAVFAYPVVEE